MSLDGSAIADVDERFSLLELDLPNRNPGPVEREIASALATVAEPVPQVRAPNPDQARIDALPVRTGLPYRPPTRAQIAATPDIRATVAPAAPVRARDLSMLLVTEDLAAGSGVAVGWSGKGELPRGVIAAVANALGLPEPRAKSEKSHAAKACQSVQSGGNYDCRAEKGKHEWIIHNVADPKHPRRVAIMQLISGKLENNEPVPYSIPQHEEQRNVIADIVTEYNRRCDAEIMTCTDITLWCDLVMRSLAAIPVAVLWYVPSAHVAKAKAFAAAMRDIWGSNWTSPPMPMIKSSELSGNLVRGFASECATVLQPLKPVEGSEGGIGSRGAAAMIERVEQLREKCRAYGALLGADHVKDVAKTLDDAIAKIRSVADDTAQRGAMLELDDAPNRVARTK